MNREDFWNFYFRILYNTILITFSFFIMIIPLILVVKFSFCWIILELLTFPLGITLVYFFFIEEI